MKAEIITIGDEILIGQIVDTNSAWLGQQLNMHGIEVFQVTSVHDQHEHILKALSEAAQNADLVLITGGLGPTKDDITKKTLCEYFETEQIFYPEVFKHVEELLSSRGVIINELNRLQAYLPANCTVLHNPVGTASGMWFEKEGTIYVSMPGVPFEMEAIMTEAVFPRLSQLGITDSIVHKTILTFGLPESMLAQKIEKWENSLPDYIKLAYLPSPMMVRLRLSAYGTNRDNLQSEIEILVRNLMQLIPENIFGFDEDNLAKVVGRTLVAQQKKLAVAESCTGGYLAHSITSNPGSSAFFEGGVVAYSNKIKTSVLKVPFETIAGYGAVSKQVAEAMAMGVKDVLKTDYSIATTGIAGPDGGSDEKPVGTIWIAIAGPMGVRSQQFIFKNNRERNIIRSSQVALNFLRTYLNEK